MIPALLLALLLGLAAPIDLGNRPPPAVALDAARRPADVLAASGIKAGDKVIDMMPGGGYYSELIGRSVGPRGKVIAISPPRLLEDPRATAAWDALIKRQPNVTLVKALPGEVALPAGIDVAFFHLTYHDLYWESAEAKFPRLDPAAFNTRLFAALKPGGSVIIIDHAGPAGSEPRAEAEATHRIDPAVAKADMEKAGFKFAGESNLLRNPADKPRTMVFDPLVRGKTDRFYYRFVKP